MKSVYIKLGLCTFVAALLALTSHIYISDWTKVAIEHIMKDFHPESTGYSNTVIYAAYASAFITVGVIVFLYYQAGHLLNISNRILKALVIAALILEIKGDLFRQPLMDYILNKSLGLDNPLLFVFLNQADKWVANLLLALCLVYLCPLKQMRETITPVMVGK